VCGGNVLQLDENCSSGGRQFNKSSIASISIIDSGCNLSIFKVKVCIVPL